MGVAGYSPAKSGHAGVASFERGGSCTCTMSRASLSDGSDSPPDAIRRNVSQLTPIDQAIHRLHSSSTAQFSVRTVGPPCEDASVAAMRMESASVPQGGGAFVRQNPGNGHGTHGILREVVPRIEEAEVSGRDRVPMRVAPARSDARDDDACESGRSRTRSH